nr:MipA/OmpV family protein [Oceanobacter mangrovi]
MVSSQDVYQGFDRRVIPFPMVIYRGDRFHLYGPYARYDLARVGAVGVALQVNPVFAGYSSSDSPALKGMDDRSYSMAGGLRMDYRPGNWQLNLTAMHDLLNVYQGYETTAGASYGLLVAGFRIEPGIQAIWQSQQYVDYYYGVKASEARPGRPQYSPNGTMNQQYSLAFSRAGVLAGAVRLQLTHTRYGKEITDSPLTDRKTAMGVNLMYSQLF